VRALNGDRHAEYEAGVDVADATAMLEARMGGQR
jgi:hypothetical protein